MAGNGYLIADLGMRRKLQKVEGSMNIKHIIIVLFAIALAGCAPARIDITKIEISEIVVLDSNFNQKRIINQPEQLSEISKIWRQLKQIQINELPNTNWTHKLDIKAGDLSGRWLYNKEGYLSRLNYQLYPTYRVENTAEFNKLILGF
jgi:hypothetical protein